MAISTIVVMILGVLIIGGGALLVSRIVNSSTNAAADLSTEQINTLKQMMNKGELVAVYPDSATVQAGKSVVFGVGIENRLDAATTFSVVAKALDADGNDASANTTLSKLKIAVRSPITIEKNSQQEAKIVVTPDKTTPRGSYSIFVTVSYDQAGTPTIYESVRFFTINVQ